MSRIHRLVLAPLAALAAMALPLPALAAGDGEDPLGANIEGKTTLVNSAGRIEARLLAGIAVKAAARRIVDAIGTQNTSLAVVVLPLPKVAAEDEIIGVAGWDTVPDAASLPVVEDMVRVRDGLESFRRRYDAAASASISRCNALNMEQSENKGVPDWIPNATNLIKAAAPLLNLFRQDFTYSGIGLGLRDGMLVTAIRGEIVARRKAAQPGGGLPAAPAGSETMAGAVEALATLFAQDFAVVRCPGGDSAELDRLAQEFEAFRSALSGPASVPGQTLLEAAESQLQRHGARPGTLVLAIDAAGASLVERRNIGTLFGAEAATVSSGLVVSYEFYEPQSSGIRALKAAGVLSCMSGTEGIRKLHSAEKPDSRARCF